MQRPPRPGIKSSQHFPFHQLRKIMTPDCFQQSMQSCLAEQTLKSMRDVTINNGVHSNISKTENVEYLQISKQFQSCADNNTKYTVNSRSFKIRNFTNLRTRTFKENTVPIKSYNKSSSNNCIYAQPTPHTSTTQYSSTIILKSYPHQFQLNLLGDAVSYRKLDCKRESIEQFDQWAIIISQSIFYGSLLQQTNILKLKNLVQNVRKLYVGINIIFHIHNVRQVDTVVDIWQKRKINVDYAIWSKHKYFQSLNAFDLSQLSKVSQIKRFIICSDSHEFTNNVYYKCQQVKYELLNGQKTQYKEYQFQLDQKSKYVYLKFHGLPNLMKFFFGKSKICRIDEIILAEKDSYTDQTQNILKLNSLKQKIKLIQIKNILKFQKQVSKKSISSKDIRSLTQDKKQALKIDKNQQFKRKILQYAKILQENIKNGQFKRNTLEMKNKQVKQQKNHSIHKLLGKQFQNQNKTKFSHQMINQLLRNNSVIFKQITKFQQKVQGLNFQQIYNVNF